MRAMRLHSPGSPLLLEELGDPVPGPGEVVLEVATCGVCRTDLHIFDGELAAPSLPLTLGHQVVGRVATADDAVAEEGARLGVPWLGWACGECDQCLAGRENLCPRARFTGLHQDGGFATHIVADARFCLPLPDGLDDIAVAPLLCAGLIGWRALRRAGDAELLGLYGFGASAHIICQIARFQGRRVFAFTRTGDQTTQAFARSLGAVWAGDAESAPPEPLGAAIVFAPAGELVPQALRAVAPGGTVVLAGIHMTEIPSMPYATIWGERTLASVANLTRADGRDILELAPRAGVRTEVHPYPLERANEALEDLRAGRFDGAAVLEIS